ncbi:hypothetical protein C8J56DRAFT_1118194, partial [Mycena floridula]
VRREKVRAALEWLIANHPEYRDLGIDTQSLAQLPENGSVVHRIPMCREGTQAGATSATGPNEAAQTDEDADSENQVTMGGVINLGSGRTTEIDQLRDGTNNILGRPTYEQHIINAPLVLAEPIPERKPGYMTRAFPTLFPDGQGDFWANRLRKVELGDYFGHLMRFEGSRFARHCCFPWFAFNTLQRHRTFNQSRFFVSRDPTAGRMTAAELQTLLADGDDSVIRK